MEAERCKGKVQEYRKLYVTLQEDGSEDDLSFIKLINYGERRGASHYSKLFSSTLAVLSPRPPPTHHANPFPQKRLS